MVIGSRASARTATVVRCAGNASTAKMAAPSACIQRTTLQRSRIRQRDPARFGAALAFRCFIALERGRGGLAAATSATRSPVRGAKVGGPPRLRSPSEEDPIARGAIDRSRAAEFMRSACDGFCKNIGEIYCLKTSQCLSRYCESWQVNRAFRVEAALRA